MKDRFFISHRKFLESLTEQEIEQEYQLILQKKSKLPFTLRYVINYMILNLKNKK